MGYIHDDVLNNHLKQNAEELSFIKAFLDDYNVTFGKAIRIGNTRFSIYFLLPEDHIKEAFGYSSEILLVYSRYSHMESRTIIGCEAIFNLPEVKGRVETLTYYLVSEDNNVLSWLKNYLNENQESRIILCFSASMLRNRTNNQYVRAELFNQSFGRDLFAYYLPLKEDYFFFGRTALISKYINVINKSENFGLFGLRKTGKTSVIFKVKRIFDSQNSGYFLILDCKEPFIRKQRWFQLIEYICLKITQYFSITETFKYDEINASRSFIEILQKVPEPNKIVLAFDEIEWISFLTTKDIHWQNDFLDFWQTIWAAQSNMRRLSAFLIGVNSQIVETDRINGLQNPLFGIVPYEYLQGLGRDETRTMMHKLGRRMGCKFAFEAVDYIFQRYGGHPVLTRMALSYINQNITVTKPVTIRRESIEEDEKNRESDILAYCSHVVSEMRDFYPDEYDMLELLSCNHVRDFIELSTMLQIKHLKDYGLVDYNVSNLPFIKIPLIGSYISAEKARREGKKTIINVVHNDHREKWLRNRLRSIPLDIKVLERTIRTKNFPLLYGPSSFPDGEKLSDITVCKNEIDFNSFINIMNKCFVESIEAYGVSIGKQNYFWKEIKSNYPFLFESLERIKQYRVSMFHLTQTPQAGSRIEYFLDKDLEHRAPNTVNDLFFVLQQCVLDSFYESIGIELYRV